MGLRRYLLCRSSRSKHRNKAERFYGGWWRACGSFLWSKRFYLRNYTFNLIGIELFLGAKTANRCRSLALVIAQFLFISFVSDCFTDLSEWWKMMANGIRNGSRHRQVSFLSVLVCCSLWVLLNQAPSYACSRVLIEQCSVLSWSGPIFMFRTWPGAVSFLGGYFYLAVAAAACMFREVKNTIEHNGYFRGWAKQRAQEYRPVSVCLLQVLSSQDHYRKENSINATPRAIEKGGKKNWWSWWQVVCSRSMFSLR